MIESICHFCKSVLYWTLDNISQIILGAVLLWANKRIRHSYIEKLIWQKRHPEEELIVVHGGYEGTFNIPKQVVGGEKEFPVKNPINEIEVLPYCDFIRCWNTLNNKNISFLPDSAVKNKTKGSFLSLGGPEYSIKSNQIVKDNRFKLEWPKNKGENLTINGREFKDYHASDQYEYAVIMRQTTDFGNSYILCAGLGAFGTQSAGNFLAERWIEILKKVSPHYWLPRIRVPDFLIILRFPRKNCKEGEIRYAAIYQNGKVNEIFYKE